MLLVLLLVLDNWISSCSSNSIGGLGDTIEAKSAPSSPFPAHPHHAALNTRTSASSASQGEPGERPRGSRARSPLIDRSQNGLPSLRYFRLPPAQPLRLALVDPTDRYLTVWKPVPSCLQFDQQRLSFFLLLPPSLSFQRSGQDARCDKAVDYSLVVDVVMDGLHTRLDRDTFVVGERGHRGSIGDK